MAKYYRGCIILSKIKKAHITTNRNGEKVIWVDLAELDQPGKYGDTHTLSHYDKEAPEGQKVTYLANFRPVEAKAASPEVFDLEDLPE